MTGVDRHIARVVGRDAPGAAAGGLLAAVALLTRLPVPAGAVDAERTGAAWFPLIGAVVGIAAVLPMVLLAPVDASLGAFAAVGVGAALTGALHLDGLADTADALLAPDRTRAEAARKDPRVGVGGVVTLLLVLGAEVAAVTTIIEDAGAWMAAVALVMVAAGARLVPVILVRLHLLPSPSTGFGAWFATRVGAVDAAVAVALAACLAVAVTALAGTWVPAAAGALAVVVGLGSALVIGQRRGGIDGDLLGAAVEWTALVGLVAVAILVQG